MDILLHNTFLFLKKSNYNYDENLVSKNFTLSYLMYRYINNIKNEQYKYSENYDIFDASLLLKLFDVDNDNDIINHNIINFNAELRTIAINMFDNCINQEQLILHRFNQHYVSENNIFFEYLVKSKGIHYIETIINNIVKLGKLYYIGQTNFPESIIYSYNNFLNNTKLQQFWKNKNKIKLLLDCNGTIITDINPLFKIILSKLNVDNTISTISSFKLYYVNPTILPENIQCVNFIFDFVGELENAVILCDNVIYTNLIKINNFNHTHINIRELDNIVQKKSSIENHYNYVNDSSTDEPNNIANIVRQIDAIDYVDSIDELIKINEIYTNIIKLLLNNVTCCGVSFDLINDLRVLNEHEFNSYYYYSHQMPSKYRICEHFNMRLTHIQLKLSDKDAEYILYTYLARCEFQKKSELEFIKKNIHIIEMHHDLVNIIRCSMHKYFCKNYNITEYINICDRLKIDYSMYLSFIRRMGNEIFLIKDIAILASPLKIIVKNENNSTLMCTICYEYKCNMFETDCGHAYCEKCIISTIFSDNFEHHQENNIDVIALDDISEGCIFNCPMCRQIVKLFNRYDFISNE